MAKLAYKTRVNSSPQGKSRVYFSCHPEDHTLYFETVSEQILQYHNCAIWYDTEPDISFDEAWMEENLSAFQLFVMPITSRLLSAPNRARDRELEFASRHHIPVLPLMEESGLDELFARYFGDLQYLAPGVVDETAISFEEKLRRYLDRTLVNDELAERIRAAFDAYIFLSYRKKDRAAAQELMRLIHKNDFCRDIAIWYDEFLVPGENFNDAIASALKKSDLFALLVTPNLINEPNYVMNTEYPLAKKEGKPIMPVEVTATDHTLLQQLYDGLPPCADGADETALSARLSEAVRHIALNEGKGSPEHTFFIGLAYFNGIDMEVDRGRGLQLIREAADRGLPEALEKMVSVYRSGEGIARDHRTALVYQERLVEAYGRLLEETGAPEDLEKYVMELYFCATYQYELGLNEEALESLVPIEELAGQLGDDTKCAFFIHASLLLCGRIAVAMGDPIKAKAYMEKNVAFDERIAAQSPTEDHQKHLANAYHGLSFVLEENGDLDGAMVFQQKAKDRILSLCEKNGEEPYAFQLFHIYDRLGDLTKELDRLGEAEDHYRVSYRYACSLDEEVGTDQAKRREHAFLGKLGDICLKKGQIKEAERLLEQKVKLCTELCHQEGTIEARSELAVAQMLLGDLHQEKGEYDKAVERYLQGCEILDELLKTAALPALQKSLAVACGNIGFLMLKGGDAAGGIDYYRKSVDLNEGLLQRYGTVDLKYAVVRANVSLADAYLTEGSVELAQKHLEAAFARVEEPVKERGSIKDHILLGELHLAAGKVYRALREPERARDELERAVGVLTAYYEKEPALSLAKSIAYSCIHLGELLFENGDFNGCERAFARGIQICNVHYRQDSGSCSLEPFLALLCYKMFSAAKRAGHDDVAEDYGLRLIRLDEALLERECDREARRSLAIDYENMGLLYDGQKQYTKAREMMEKAILLRRQDAAEQKDTTTRFLLCRDLDKLGNILRLANDPEAALPCLEEAEALCRELIAKEPIPKHRNQQGIILYHRGLALQAEAPEEAISCIQGSADVLEKLFEVSGERPYAEGALVALEALEGLLGRVGREKAQSTCRARVTHLRCMLNGSDPK